MEEARRLRSALSHRYRSETDGDYTANAVSRRYLRALSGAMLSSAAFDNIDKLACADSTRAWAEEEEHAKRERIRNVAVMDIYDIKMERREFHHAASLSLKNWLQSLLGQKYFLN